MSGQEVSETLHEQTNLSMKMKGLYVCDKPIPELNSLEDLVKELHKVFEFDVVNVDYVKDLLSAYTSNPVDWKKYSKFDPFKYTRNLVDSGNGKFNLIALCWGEGHGSSIHDHSSSDCFVKILDGELMETMYTWPKNCGQSDAKVEMSEDIKEDEHLKITELGNKVYKRNQVTFINDSMGLHRMSNPSHSDKTVSLHLYCPPFDSCQVFDQRTGQSHAAKVTFWSKFGERTPWSPNASSSKLEGPISQCCQEGVDKSSK